MLCGLYNLYVFRDDLSELIGVDWGNGDESSYSAEPLDVSGYGSSCPIIYKNHNDWNSKCVAPCPAATEWHTSAVWMAKCKTPCYDANGNSAGMVTNAVCKDF